MAAKESPMPYSTTIREYKVATQDFDASVGHTAGATISIMTNAGGNALHGDLTDQYWNQRWNGTPFFVKQAYNQAIVNAENAGNLALAKQFAKPAVQPCRPRSGLWRSRRRSRDHSETDQWKGQALFLFQLRRI